MRPLTRGICYFPRYIIALLLLACVSGWSSPAAATVGVDEWQADRLLGDPTNFDDFAIGVDDSNGEPWNLYVAMEGDLHRRVGGTWSTVPTAALPNGINANAVSAYFWQQRVLVGTFPLSSNYYGVHWSDDNGTTWSAERPAGGPDVYPNPGNTSFRPVAFAQDDNGAIYAADWGGAIKSTDGGQSWTRVFTNVNSSALSPGAFDITIHKDVIFLTTLDYGIIRSDDHGASWMFSSLSQGPPNTVSNSYASIGNALYVVAANDRIYKTTNLGDSWAQIQSNVPHDNQTQGGIRSISSIGDALIAVGPTEAAVSLRGNPAPQVFYTFDDGGAAVPFGGSWKGLPPLNPPSSSSNLALSIRSQGSKLFLLVLRPDSSSPSGKYHWLYSITPKLTPPNPPEKNLGDCPCISPPIVGDLAGGDGGTGGGSGSGGGMPSGGINAGTGNLFQSEVDYAGAPATRLALVRNYNSLAKTNGVDRPGGLFGKSWWTRYDNRISAPGGIVREVIHGDGRVDTFVLINNVWTAEPDVTTKLLPQVGGSWIVVNPDDSKEAYDSLGKLTSMTTRAGQVTTLTYDVVGRLSTITGPFGHALTLTYDPSNRVNKVTEPDPAKFTTYTYNANGNLASATYPDGKTRNYLYENLAFPDRLTGVKDENARMLALYAYDMKGRAISIARGQGNFKTQVAYKANGTTEVTTPSGAVRTYSFTTLQNVVKPVLINGSPCTTCGGVGFTYDPNGFVSSVTDSNGNVTNYSFDARGLEIGRIEAFNTPQARTITTTWDTQFRLPLTISEPNRTTNFGYDTAGNLLTRSVTTAAGTRTWAYTYNGLGQVLTVNGPRTDVSDVTTYAYYPNNGTAPYGMLQSVTNALGHVTTYTTYDVNGRVTGATDANGTATALTYDPRGRLLTRTTGGLTTSYQYDFAGNVTRLTRPDGAYVNFTYDAAYRVTRVADNLGNSINYLLDANGKVTRETVRNALDVVTQQRDAAYDNLSRLAKSIGAVGQTTRYTYDNNGNLTAVTDGLNQTGSLSYDALDRQTGGTDPLLGQTAYSYDVNDNLTQVRDPRNLATGYGYDSLGNRVGQNSPDTAASTFLYDDAGNVTQSTDAAGRVQTYAYDALNRLTVQTATGLANTVFSYDAGTNGKGRLTGLTDMSGTMSWTYDGLGRLLTQVQSVTGAATRTISYSYNASGQLASMTYPSGKVVAYGYNTNGQVSSLTLNGANLITSITYQPFGGVKGWTLGNGTAYARTYDLDGRLLSYPLGSRTRTLTYDNAGRITAYTDSNSAYSQSFGYDANDRLTSWTGGWGISESYTYDGNGNRRTVSVTGQTLATLAFPTTNNKFTSQTGGGLPFTPAYDATGNMTAINNGITLVYDGRNRVASSTAGGITTNYWVNGLGQRVRKTWNGTPASHVLFTYAPDGKHIGSYDLNGALTEETIFLGDTPIAVVTGAGTFNLYADHINAIRQVTNQTNQTRWSWEQTNAFGSTLPNQNPSGLGTFNYRRGFPGQFYDAELLTWNNGFRTYHAGIGRYLQPDPIGLAGGDPSMFGYVGQMPNMATDPFGLIAGIDDVIIVGGVVIAGGAAAWWASPQNDRAKQNMAKDLERLGDNFAANMSSIGDKIKKWVKDYCPVLSAANDNTDEPCRDWHDELLDEYDFLSAMHKLGYPSRQLLIRAYNDSVIEYRKHCLVLGYPDLPTIDF